MNACKRESIWRRGLPLLAACIRCGMHSLKIKEGGENATTFNTLPARS